MTASADYIYKIEGQADWASALQAGHYAGSADDRRDGFIHLSTAEQARVTAAKYFAGRSDLIIAAIDPASCASSLKWEASRGGALFPHLYATLPRAAVVWTKVLPLDANGHHAFPPEMI